VKESVLTKNKEVVGKKRFMVRGFSRQLYLLSLYGHLSGIGFFAHGAQLFLGAQDPVVDQVFAGLAKKCNCNCCMTQERLPGELKYGLTHKCSPSPQGPTPDCPALCDPSSRDIVLTAAAAETDYPRYCMLKCLPVAPLVGSTCRRQTDEEAALALDSTGNGSSEAGKPFSLASPPEEESEAAKEAKKEIAAEKDPLEVKRVRIKVIDENKRAQAAGSMAHAASSLSRAHIDSSRVESSANSVLQAASRVSRTSNVGVSAEMGATNEVREAEENAHRSFKVNGAAELLAKKQGKKAKEEAILAIRTSVHDLAVREANADAARFSWDKPENWPRVLAVRAANPYLETMVAAIQRVSEYEAVAKGLLGKAKGEQEQAQKLETQEQAYAFQGDSIGAAKVRHEIDILLASAAKHNAEAEKNMHVAEDTRKTIPEYQEGGRLAAEYTRFSYKHDTSGDWKEGKIGAVK